ncbi:MAG: hypothetical protein U0841_35425, partial [Chloroflexia bacterium]
MSESDWPGLLRAADQSAARGEIHQARDQLAEFRATAGGEGWAPEAILLEGAIDGVSLGARAGLAVLERLDLGWAEMRIGTRVRGMLERHFFAQMLGEREQADSILNQAASVADESERKDLVAAVLRARADQFATRGETAAALAAFAKARELYAALDRTREAWGSLYCALRLKLLMGEWEQVTDACKNELIPVAQEALRDERLGAIGRGLLAAVSEARGELDEALRIRREDELPVYERLGDARSRATTMGNIADILQARGELDEALRIRRKEQLPVHERLGDVRERAVTMGKIADILQARGELDEALRIRREE